jgi:D-aspartate ligase
MGEETDTFACVLGDMDLVRPLAIAGIPCVTVSPADDPIRLSRFSAASLDWVDHWTRQDELVERLSRFGMSQGSRPVLLYQTTGDLLTISRHRERLREAFRFMIPEAQLVEDLADKARFHALAAHLGLPVPRTSRLRPSDNPDGWRLDLQYPLVLKPVTRHFDRWSKVEESAKAVRVDSPSALRELWPRLMTANLELLAQELVVGPESNIESYHAYVDEAGNRVAYFTGRKIRTRPAEFGHSTSVVITEAPDVAALGDEVMRRIGLVGVAKLDFKRTLEGELRLLEVNTRLTLWNHPGAVAGVNIPALLFADLVGRQRPPHGPARPGVAWCDLWEDAAAAREVGRLDRSWLRFAFACEAKSGFSLEDPLPFLWGVAARRISRHARKRAASYLCRRPHEASK